MARQSHSRGRYGLREDVEDEPSWKFAQVFGDRAGEEIAAEDVISAGEFCHSGDFFATGDRGGRVVVFKRQDNSDIVSYNFYCEFQSHEAEFDYLKSMEIEERIAQICWLRRKHASQFILSTNDRTIKLWKVFERRNTVETGLNDNRVGLSSVHQLRVPRSSCVDTRSDARCKRVFANGHSYNINSISLNRDDETFISVDDLRINLWNLEIADQSFNIVDLKPAHMEELSEVITTAQCHPDHSQIFMYSTSKGATRLCDMRAAALCDKHARSYQDHVSLGAGPAGFFHDLVCSVTDTKFSHDGRFFAVRDYLTVKVWDMMMEKRPVEVFKVHDHVRPALPTLYEKDALFDRFQVNFSHNDEEVITGSYSNQFRIFDRISKRDTLYEASHKAVDFPEHNLVPIRLLPGSAPACRRDAPLLGDSYVDDMDYNQKALLPLWHPHEPILAIAAVNNLFVFAKG